MAKIKSKGTVLSLEIATVKTAVGQLISVKPPTERSLDFDGTTLDTTLGKEKELSGYAEAEAFEAELFWDPELAVQAAILALIKPTPAEGDWEIDFVNAGASNLAFTSVGLELGVAVEMDNGLKASIKGNVDGLPTLTV